MGGKKGSELRKRAEIFRCSKKARKGRLISLAGGGTRRQRDCKDAQDASESRGQDDGY